MKADFLIVGTMKSGTSTLSYILGQHEKIAMPKKEVHFFNRNYGKGLSWYQNVLEKNMNSFTEAIGEKTPPYCLRKLYAERIKEYNPDIKLIWVFREPVSRTYSHYLHKLKTGAEIFSFEKGLRLERRRIAKKSDADLNLGYIRASLYSEQVEMYSKYFSKEQMKFLLFEDLKERPERVVNEVLDFLGVSSEGFQFQNEIRNKTVLPKFPLPLYIARRLSGRGRLFNYTEKLTGYLFATTDKKPEMKQFTKEELKKFFEPYNEKLALLTGLDVSKWNQD